jgi:AAA domain
MEEKEADPRATSYATIEPLDPEWLCEGLIPQGELTLIAGEGGVGKGFWMADMTARVTRGDVMPNGTQGPPPGSVITITLEDDPNTAMAWRLKAAGARLDRVHDMTRPGGNDFVLGLKGRDDLGLLREFIAAQQQVRMVYMDPLAAISAISLGSNTTVRHRIVEPLQKVARDTGVAIVLMHHVVKSGVIAGSVGLQQAMRSVIRIDKDPANPLVRVVRLDKTNIASIDQVPLRYVLQGTWPDIRVHYLSTPHTRDAAGKGTWSGEDVVLDCLLAADRPLDLQQIAAMTGIAYDVVRVYLSRLKTKGSTRNDLGVRGMWAATERVAAAYKAHGPNGTAPPAPKADVSPPSPPPENDGPALALSGGQASSRKQQPSAPSARPRRSRASVPPAPTTAQPRARVPRITASSRARAVTSGPRALGSGTIS